MEELTARRGSATILPDRGRPVHRFGILASLVQSYRTSNGAPPDAMLTSRALLIWSERPDLRCTFELGSQAGRVGLFWWYLLHGYRELGLGPDDDDAALSLTVNRPVPHLAQHSFTPITWLIREVYRRSGLAFGPLRKRECQQQLLAWFFANGLMENRLGAFLCSEQAEALRASDNAATGVPRIVALIWQADPQLHARFAGLHDPAFLAWCKGGGARDYPILAHPGVALAPPWRPPSRVSGRFGVNLVGHAFARSGLSEDLRAAALTLQAAGIPYAIHNVSPGAAFGKEDMSLAAHATQELPFDVHLFCFPGQSTVTAALANPALERDRRYAIGMWPWELPEWPRFWQHAYGFVDEIWASSRFTYDAFCRSAPVPVRHMPMAVTVAASEGAARLDFGLAANKFLFAFAFDGFSTFTRKNPGACIAAFQAAFPDREQPVGVVIKGLRVQGSDAWDGLNSLIGDDPRVTVITESMSRGRLLDLYRAVDCFVSLHRSEGFGRNIAEAMLLEKPVIVTAHSGNMDFTAHDTAALVPARLVPLIDGDYPFGNGQIWAEADVRAAAGLMQRIVHDREWRRTIALAGRERIEQLYSPRAVSERWMEVLRTLGARSEP